MAKRGRPKLIGPFAASTRRHLYNITCRHPGAVEPIKNRLNRAWERLFTYLHELYGWQYDFFYTLEQILDMLIRYWLDRPEGMR